MSDGKKNWAEEQEDRLADDLMGETTNRTIGEKIIANAAYPNRYSNARFSQFKDHASRSIRYIYEDKYGQHQISVAETGLVNDVRRAKYVNEGIVNTFCANHLNVEALLDQTFQPLAEEIAWVAINEFREMVQRNVIVTIAEAEDKVYDIVKDIGNRYEKKKRTFAQQTGRQMSEEPGYTTWKEECQIREGDAGLDSTGEEA